MSSQNNNKEDNNNTMITNGSIYRKHLNLSFDPYIFSKIKEKKEKTNAKSWEEFIISAVLSLSDKDLDYIALQQLSEELNTVYYRIQTIKPQRKYQLELIRIISLHLLYDNQDKAVSLTQQLLNNLKGVNDGTSH